MKNIFKKLFSSSKETDMILNQKKESLIEDYSIFDKIRELNVLIRNSNIIKSDRNNINFKDKDMRDIYLYASLLAVKGREREIKDVYYDLKSIYEDLIYENIKDKKG